MAYSTFQNFLNNKGLKYKVLTSREDTKTAIQASQVHNVPVCNIVKSLLVKVGSDFKLFLVPGDRRLDLNLIKSRFSVDNVRMANADEVKEITGYSIGGVPPFGHLSKLDTYVEDGFDKQRELVAAAGSGNSVFRIKYEDLKGLISRL